MSHHNPPVAFIEKSHPDFAAEQREAAAHYESQLVFTAQQIDAHRIAAGKSQNVWCRMWPALGSQKTYAKILAGDFEGVSVEKKLPDYRAALSAITANVGSAGAETLYDDLPGSQAVMLAALRLMHHDGKDRLILILGGSGSGKTSSLEVLESQGAGGSKLYRLEADETWKSPRAALRRMLLAVKVPEGNIPANTAAMEDLLITTLGQQGRCTMAIDEAHHVSGCVLNLFKTLLNRTQLRLILAGMATLFQKLRANSSEEAKQLIHNRLFERVELSGPDEETARTFLSRRLGMDGKWKNGTLNIITATAQHCGHWSFLRRIVDQLRTSGITSPGDADLLAATESARREIA